MLVILPPSETKRDGGAAGSALDLDSLRYPGLASQRAVALSHVRSLSRSVTESTAALKLGPKQRFEIDRNRVIASSPLMPAMDRYTGVLYEALDAPELDTDARAWLAGHVVVHSALFGLLGAGDVVPAYRLSHDSRLPKLPLKKHWRDAIADELATESGLVLDLRSESYVAMGPAPDREGSYYLRVVSAASDGTKRALNHFNKKGKGELVRALAEAGIVHEGVDSLLEWAASAGIRLERTGDSSGSRVLDLVV